MIEGNKMSSKKSITDYFGNFGKQSEITKIVKAETINRIVKVGLIGGAIGLTAGIAGGVYVGESINDYVEFLKQAHPVVQYAVDAASAVACGVVGARIGRSIAQLPEMYKLLN